MPALMMSWTPLAKLQFDVLRQRANDTGKLDEFINVHNEIVTILRDLNQALKKVNRCITLENREEKSASGFTSLFRFALSCSAMSELA